MRRILVVPSISRKSVADDPAYREFYALTKRVSESGERAYWYMIVPPWVQDGLLGHDRLSYIHLEGTRDPMINDMVGFPALEIARQFARRGGRHVIDAVITDCSLFSAYLCKLLSDKERGPVPVVLREHHEAPIRDVPEEWTLLASNYISGRVAVRSEWNRSILAQFAGRYINPAMSKLMLKRAVHWPVGYDTAQMDEASKGVQRGDKPVLFVGGGFDKFVNKRPLLKLVERLSVAGVADVVLVTTDRKYRVEKWLPAGDRSVYSVFHTGVRWEMYLRELSRYHCFVSFADDMTMSDEIEDELLRLMMGQVGVFPYTKWVSDRLGDDYPFFYNPGNEAEATAMIEWVVSNFKEAQEMVSDVAVSLREKHDERITMAAMWSELATMMDDSYRVHPMKRRPEGSKQPLFALIHDVATRMGKEFALDVFLDVLEEHATWLKPWGRKGTLKQFGDVEFPLPTMYDLREMLDNLGWIDQCDGINIRVKKEREPLPGVFDGQG